MLSRRAVSLLRQPVRASSYGHHEWKSGVQLAHEFKTHMDYFPKPQGPWKEGFNRRAQRWNMMLLGAAGFFGATVVWYGWLSGALPSYKIAGVYQNPPAWKAVEAKYRD